MGVRSTLTGPIAVAGAGLVRRVGRARAVTTGIVRKERREVWEVGVVFIVRRVEEGL